MNCVKGEIHNVLSMMRVNARWASGDRFKREIPAATQSPMMRAFKQLHYELQWVTDLSDVDTVTYLLPFIMVIESERTSGFITGAAISSLNKFLLYGLITSESLRADVAINRIAVCVARCRFEETHRADDEAVLMKLLELVEYCLRCDAGHLIAGDNVWKMMQLCYSISCQPRSSVHLCRAAENTLAHLILTVFDRIDQLEPIKEDDQEDANDTDGSDLRVKRPRASGYGIALLEQILLFLSGLISPAAKDDSTCILGLRLINIVLETAGTGLGNHPRLVTVLQGDLSKYLLQNSETEDPAILSLILRVVFNLFNSIKDHLKVQLEVFFTSVHMRIIDSPSCSDEQKELALESLLEFCREPAMMLDLYINYDCDVHCTNLFEVLCKSLARNCQAMEGPNGNLNALTVLCLEGLLAVIESIARRCPLGSNSTTTGPTDVTGLQGSDLARLVDGSAPFSGRSGPPSDIAIEDVSPMSSVRDLMHLVMSGSDSESDSDQSDTVSTSKSRHRSKSPSMDQLAWLHTARERTAEVLQQRKRAKKRYALAAEKFNTDQKNWISYAQEMELLPETLTPESVASFLLNTPGLNKTLIGDYLGDGPPEKYPFNTAVRDAYIELLDFRDASSLDEALRLFLARFRLPGEAQKIDRMMEAFSKRFYAQCASSGPLADADAAYVLAFSIIMLNTDLHSDHIAKKMTLEEFIRNNRGINAGQDLPEDYLTMVYNNINEREIQMQHDVSDFNEQVTVDRYSTQWEGVLKRSENVVGASFTSNSSILKLRAGLYEKDMFNLICDSTIKCISLAYEKTCDLTNMERALDGLSNCAKIALYYDVSELFNKIMASLSTYFLTFAHGILNGEKIFMPPTSSANAALNKRHSLSVQPAQRGASRRRLSSIENSSEGEESEDAVPGSPLAGAVPEPEPFGVIAPIGEDHLRGAKVRRALLSLKLLFQFVQQRHESFRKAWASVIECVLMFNELDVVPTSLVEMDDFVDARGVPLPPIQGGASSQPSPTNSTGPTATVSSSAGVSGKTRERSRRVAERQAAIRSRMKGMSSGGNGHATSYGNAGQTNSGSIWDSLSSYLWAEEEKVDENFSLVSKMLRDAVVKLGGGILEKENWLRMERKLQEPSLTSLLETLLTCRDPFKGMLMQAVDGAPASAPAVIDPMMQENAILVLELSVDLILVNAHRIVALKLWERFHKYAERILQTPLSELHHHLHGLAERVIVHILRVSIRLFHDEKIRPQLMKTLKVLLEMDDGMYKALSDRVAIGINMLLKANLVYMHDFHEWDVLMGILENVVQYKNGRAPCWESVKLLAEGGHLNDENVTLWIATCLRFVSHRTPYSVDALRLLQGLAASESAYKMDGRAWLEVMRVMLSYLNDDRAPIAKTAWECLYNSLLLPGVPVAKDTWQHCFEDVIFTFDNQVNEGVWRHSKDASLYSVALLSKTFLHNLSVLIELPDFNGLWLSVLRRLAHKLRTAGPLAASSSHAAVVFETTLQSLYNLLLILQAEQILDRACTLSTPVDGAEPSVVEGTLFEATYAVVDDVIPHMKEQLGLVPPPPEPVPEEPQPVEIEGRDEAQELPQTSVDEETRDPGSQTEEQASNVAEAADADVLAAHFRSTADAEPQPEAPQPPRSASGRVLETVVTADGSVGVKVDEILIDEITEAV